MKTSFLKFSLATKLVGWFLLVALIPLAFFGYINYRNAESIIEREVKNNLISIADNRAKQIEIYFNERLVDASILAKEKHTIETIENISSVFVKKGVSSSEYIILDKRYRPFLTSYKREHGYYDLLLISTRGDIIFSIKHENDFKTNLKKGPYKDSELAKVFNQALRNEEMRISDFRYYAPSNKPAAFIAASIINNKKIIGVVAFHVSNKKIYELMQVYIGLGETGETLVGAKIGNEAVFVNPLRHDPDAAFKRKVVIGSKDAIPIQKAVQGIEGLGLSIDYRGKKILAAWRYIPLLRWGMVVKIDTEEAFSSISDLRYMLFLIAFIILLCVVFMAIFSARTITRPIKALQKGAEVVGKGNLDFQVGTKKYDEIGQLSREFDQMTSNLKNITASRDELNNEIIERKRAEKEMKNALDVKTRFISMASHELRTPLASIKESVNLISEGLTGEINDDQKRFLDMAKNNLVRLGRLINDILDFQKLEEGKMEFDFSENNINEIAATVESTMHLIAEQKGLYLNIELDKRVSQIQFDKDKIIQVITNLVDNSIKFTKNGGVTIVTSKNNNGVRVSVHDTGPGIKNEDSGKLFKSFQQLDPGKDKLTKGTGLGLAICKEIVLGHNGKIWVESEFGKGSTFHFVLPIKDRRG